MDKLNTALAAFFLGIFAIALIAIVTAWPVQLLWNHCLVDAFNGQINPIGFWQALGIQILCGLLFKSHKTTSKSSD
jgi:hypothetical protein